MRQFKFWDAQTGGKVGNPLKGHTSFVWSVAFSPDGRYIVSGSGDKMIQIWDAQTGGQVGSPLQGHTATVLSVAFSPDGRHIVSCSNDKTIQLWDAQTGAQVGNPLQGHTLSVLSVAFSPDGRHIVSGSLDTTIRLWNWAQTSGYEQTLSSKSVTTSPIYFSSSVAHALQNAQSLFVDTSNLKGDWRDIVQLQADGWIVGPNGQLLLWVPPSYHLLSFYSPWTRMVIPKGIPELDLSNMVHGTAWYECYSPA